MLGLDLSIDLAHRLSMALKTLMRTTRKASRVQKAAKTARMCPKRTSQVMMLMTGIAGTRMSTKSARRAMPRPALLHGSCEPRQPKSHLGRCASWAPCSMVHCVRAWRPAAQPGIRPASHSIAWCHWGHAWRQRPRLGGGGAPWGRSTHGHTMHDATRAA